jgi:predicted Holliday junction resolvase-like endonuclease
MLNAKAQEIIRFLETRNFYAECPCCGRPVLLASCGLFYLDDFTPQARRLYEDYQTELKERALELKQKPDKIKSRAKKGAKHVNIGFMLERLVPVMKGFRFARNDCWGVFDPIDYVIFENLSTKGLVSRIIFAEVKAGGAPLKPRQKEIRSLVEAKKVSLDVYMSEDEE